MVFGLATSIALSLLVGPQNGVARGIVFDDRNGNGKRDSGEPGVAGVRVSNSSEITKTDRSGKWSLKYTDDTIFFVIKPRGWMTPIDKDMLPRFYYIHKPAGSPAFKYPGVSPTGPLPASIEFPLTRRAEPNRFTAVFFGDTQPRDLREVDYIARDIVEPLIGKLDAKFGVTLGDVVFDDLSVFQPLASLIALLGLPWYNVLGNHDMNYDAETDEHSDESFERVFGPSYYSFDYGPTHFVVLDNVVWKGAKSQPSGQGSYSAGLGPKQLAWLKSDLDTVPSHQLVVLMMHIPMNEMADKAEVFRLLEKRPFALSISAHTHFQEHRLFTAKDGWMGKEPHHHVVNVTTCGSWWQGAPDESGIPHTTMRDGAPNGYSLFTFDGNQYSIEFRAARRLPGYQMSIQMPNAVKAADSPLTPVYVNVFGGSERSKVEIRVAGGPWRPMVKVLEADPEYKAAADRDKGLTAPYRPLPAPIQSPHLWRGYLPQGLEVGVIPVHVRTTDMHGQVYYATRAIRIE